MACFLNLLLLTRDCRFIYGSSVVGRASLPAILRLRTALMAGRDARPTDQKLSILNKSTVPVKGEMGAAAAPREGPFSARHFRARDYELAGLWNCSKSLCADSLATRHTGRCLDL